MSEVSELRSQVAGLRIGIVHYGEHVPLDESYRPARMGQLAAWLTEAGADVTRFAPTYSHFAGCQRESWTGASTAEGTVVMVPTRPFESNRGVERLGFFADFASGTASAVAARPPFDVLLVGFPPPGVVSALRTRVRPCPPILADIRDLWPDALLTGDRPALARAIAVVGHGLASELRLTSGVVAMSATMLGRGPRRRRHRAIPYSISSELATAEPSVAPNGGLQAVFVGILNDFFDLATVVAGWSRFEAERDPTVGPPHLRIFGSGPLEGDLRELAADIDTATVAGWLPSAEVPTVVAQADVGISPTQPGLGTTLSNKVLEYLGTGALVLHTLEDEAADELAAACLGTRVTATAEGWADAFLTAERRLATIRSERASRRAVALERYGRTTVERLWLSEIVGVSGVSAS